MTKAALARELGLTARHVQTYEVTGAPASRAQDLSQALGVQPEFFDLPARNAIESGQGFFRARRRATAAQMTSARAAASLGVELYEWIEARFRLPEVTIPELDQYDPEQAAGSLRAAWGRGEEPLPNLVQLAEAKGVRVLSLPPGTSSVDAFSLWVGEVPYVFLATHKSAERSRFDLAHELGHLVLHAGVPALRGGEGLLGAQIEKEADAFASAFLMPARQVLAHSRREPAVPEILELRSFYKVSAMAMTKRLADLGRLTDWNYRQNCVHLTQRGFRTGEPGGIERERSRVFVQVFSTLREQGVRTGQVARELGLSPDEIHALTFGQATISVAGREQPSHTGKAHLRVVR